jgi:nucleoside-diphosphate-sugar epimerase
MLMGAAATHIEYDTFNIGSGTGLPFKEMASLVSRTVGGVPVKFVPWPKERYFVETGDYISDITKIRRALGWAPKVSIEDGVERTVAYYREHGRRYFSLPRRAAAR